LVAPVPIREPSSAWNRHLRGETMNTAAKKASAGNTGFNKALTPSKELAAVIGAEAVPRTEVTKKIWDYIKQQNLQDPANKRNINADEKLKAVFGGKDHVSMFEMTKLLSAHLKG
jgi:chromatin remodeling complex protein RSC6